MVVTISVLFNFFANLMLCYFAPDKSENGLVGELKLRSAFQARDYIVAMRNYNAFKCIEIIDCIRRSDAKSKGVNSGAMSQDSDILREMVFRIMH